MRILILACLAAVTFACTPHKRRPPKERKVEQSPAAVAKPQAMERAAELTEYTEFQLTADMSHLSDNQRAMVKKLIEASTHMEAAFWRQA
ncbi:MAG: Zn-dependent hydrolase, partial [Myxococcota bacterium]